VYRLVAKPHGHFRLVGITLDTSELFVPRLASRRKFEKQPISRTIHQRHHGHVDDSPILFRRHMGGFEDDLIDAHCAHNAIGRSPAGSVELCYPRNGRHRPEVGLVCA
jgi:hypothetical protein